MTSYDGDSMAIPWRWQSTELGRSSPYLATLILPPVVPQEGAVILSVVQATQALWFPVLIWGVLLGFFLAILFAVDEGLKRLRQLHQVPCDRCRFNSANPYLRRPVHPLKAFTQEAIHCPDYEPTCRPNRWLSWPWPRQFLKGILGD
jgi:hypothetical protein